MNLASTIFVFVYVEHSERNSDRNQSEERPQSERKAELAGSDPILSRKLDACFGAILLVIAS